MPPKGHRKKRSPNDPENIELRWYQKPPLEDNLFKAEPEALPPDYYCRAAQEIANGKYSGLWTYCYRRAGQDTDHDGLGRCKWHDGGEGFMHHINPVLARRYAHIDNPKIEGLIQQYLDDPDILNIIPELAASRALFTFYIEELDELVAAFLAWHASFDAKRRGLHDAPLYHAQAVQRAIQDMFDDGVDPVELDLEEMNDYLSNAAERYKREWASQAPEGQERAPDLKVERPKKMPDMSEGRKMLETIANLSEKAMEHEQKAWLSHDDYANLLKEFGRVVKLAVERYIRSRGLEELSHEELAPLLRDIALGFNVAAEQYSVSRFARDYARRTTLSEWIQQGTKGQLPQQAD